tara:strand:- start:324 stop:512 length:189 start_codon:yes stop_codon:yes gene_type:complete
MQKHTKAGFLCAFSSMLRFARKVMGFMSDLGMFLCCHLGISHVDAHVWKNDNTTGVHTSHDA